MPKETKATAAEVERRVMTIYDRLLAGASRVNILQYVAKTGEKDAGQAWNVETRQIDEYIHDATDRIRDAAVTHRELELAKAILRLESLYAQAMRVQDFKLCLSVIREQVTLLHLNEPPPASPLDMADRQSVIHAALIDAAAIPDAARRALALGALYRAADSEGERRALQERVSRLEGGL